MIREEDAFILPDGEAHHMQRVLRARSGDLFEVVDSNQDLFVAEMQDGRKATILEKSHGLGKSYSEVTLYQAVPKGKHMDLIVEKATELGVDCIVPLVTEHNVARPGGGGAKIGRWRRLAEAAARQSLQLRVPEVADPVWFEEVVGSISGGGILLHNEAELSPLEEVIGDTATSLFVGPEGGWSESEVRAATENGLSVAQLGPYRLRSETAGISAVARTMAALGRLAEKT